METVSLLNIKDNHYWNFSCVNPTEMCVFLIYFNVEQETKPNCIGSSPYRNSNNKLHQFAKASVNMLILYFALKALTLKREIHL